MCRDRPWIKKLAIAALIASSLCSCVPSGPTSAPDQTERPTATTGSTDRSIPTALAADESGWVPVFDPDFQPAAAASVHAVEPIGDGGITLGSVGDRGVVWASADGTSWTSGQITGVGPRTTARTAAGSADRYVVATHESKLGLSSLWMFDDDRWEAVADQVDFPSRAVVRDITWDGETFLAVGAIYLDADNDLAGAQAAAWSSADGRSWRREELPMLEGELRKVERRGGTAVAVGSVRIGQGEDGLLVVRDAAGWRLAPAEHLAEVNDESLTRVVSTDRLWLATGVIQPPGCRAAGCVTAVRRYWTSIDTIDWESHDADDRAPVPFGVLGDAFIAEREQGEGSIVEASTDGRSWEPVTPEFSIPTGVMVGSFAVIAGRVVVVGQRGGEVVMWRAPKPN